MRAASLLLACGVLASCRFIPPPSPMDEVPESVPRAQLRVIAEPDFAVVNGTPRGDCTNSMNVDIQRKGRIIGSMQYQRRGGAFDGRSLGMPAPERLDVSPNMRQKRGGNDYSGELYIEADKPFLLTYNYHEYVFGYYIGCRIDLAFTPQEGRDYEARFWADTKERRCIGTLNIHTENGLWLPLPSKVICEKRPLK